MARYNFQKEEAKWQKLWLKEGVYEPRLKGPGRRKKFYNLMMFPYPSAEGLHAGNMYAFTGSDVYGRYKRMQGLDVFEPIGLDGFGIHSENYALKVGTHPMKQVKISEKRFYKQLEQIGNGFAWREHLETYDPEYYRWTQWIFIQMWKAGLAYRKKQAVNWCPSCKTVLADEQVIAGKCERCGTVVIKRDLEQWFFRITKYAEKLLNNLNKLDWSEKVKIAQRNWIGKSEGAEIEFPIADNVKRIIILHGRNGRPNNYVFPWLKKELEKKGYEVEVPALPHTEEPNDEEQADYVEKHYDLDENTAIVAQSFGGIVAMRLLERGHRIARVTLAVVPFTGRFNDHKIRRSVTAACQKGFDFPTIKKNAKEFIILRDESDEIVPKEDADLWNTNLNGVLIEGRGTVPHFSGDQEPDMLLASAPGVRVFTTRPDTLFGATYLVLAPEHPAIKNLECRIKNLDEVKKYVRASADKPEEERIAEGGEKTGVELKGIKAVNPATGQEIPVWTADYVVGHYGTGAIMAVPAHDERDFEFAKKFNLPIVPVITNHENKSHNFVIIHGCPKEEREMIHTDKINARHWIPWLKQELEKAGLEAHAPLMPQAWKANYADWKKEFEKLPIGENTVLIGHSCGASFLVRWLGDTKRKVAKLVLVAPSKIAAENAAEHRAEFYDFQIDPNIKDRVREIIILVSNDEERHRKSAKLYKNALDARVIELQGRGHFIVDNIPELFKVALENSGAYSCEGVLINSFNYNGLTSAEARTVLAKKFGTPKIQYRLRDWLISRQRYWGAPIPMIHCPVCAKGGKGEHKDMPGWYAEKEKNLPVKLPFVKDFRPKGKGESPLASVKSFYAVKCPVCKSPARRETDVSDTFLDSAWYYLRYPNVQVKNKPWDPAIIKKWFPVDMYIGGAEHSVLHLLYVRFMAMALRGMKLINFEEPFPHFRAHGLIIKDGAKMSKSKGNIVNPDEYVAKFSADVLRTYLMFLAPFEAGGDFRDEGILGVDRFLNGVRRYFEAWAKTGFKSRAGLSSRISRSKTRENEPFLLRKALHKTIRKVSEDIESLKYNTAISQLMILFNELADGAVKNIYLDRQDAEGALKLIAPFAPYLTETLWRGIFKNKKSIHLAAWPKWEKKYVEDDTFTLVIQVNGKVRGSVEAQAGISESAAKELALREPRVREALGGKTPRRIIYVPGRILNIVV